MKKRRNIQCFLFVVLSLFCFLLSAPRKVRAEEEDTSVYFYNQLTQCEKDVYDQIKAGAETFVVEEAALPEGTTRNDVFNMVMGAGLSAYTRDNPLQDGKIRWIDVEYVEADACYVCTVQKSDATEYHFEKVEAILTQWAGAVDKDADRYTKLRQIFEIVANNLEYEYFLMGGYSWTGGSFGEILGVLHGRMVCQGYSGVVKVLCDMNDIPCVRVYGLSSGSGHAWNAVQMEDGKWYLLDTTGVAPGTWSNVCALVGMEEAEIYGYTWGADKEPGERFAFPELSEERYRYSGNATDFSYVMPELEFTEPEPELVYAVNEDGLSCTITSYQGVQEGDLNIPDVIDGYTVTGIGASAFSGCLGFDGQLIIPDTVTYIGEFAFYGCKNLKGVISLPAALERMEDGAFMRCSGFTGDLVFPETVSYIGAMAFSGCNGLDGDLYYPENWKDCYIGQRTFSYCENFKGTLYLPDDYEFNSSDFEYTYFSKLGVSESNEFYKTVDGVLYNLEGTELLHCPSGKSGTLTIPEGVKKVCDSAAFKCEKLTEIVFPQSLEYIGEYGFYYTWDLENLCLPDSVTYIGANAFWGGAQGQIHIPEGLTEICDNAFFGNSEEVLVIPDSVTKIGRWSIGGSFEYIVLSDSVTQIADEAILVNGSIGAVYYKASNEVLAQYAANNPRLTWIAYENKEDIIGSSEGSMSVPQKPYKITNTVSGVHVYWDAVDGVSQYGVWRSETGKDGTYQWLGNPGTEHFIDTGVMSGTTYFYKITSYDGETEMHSDMSEAIGITFVGTPDITERTNVASGIALGWEKIEGATGYAIYRRSYAGSDAWVRIATIEGNETFAYTDTSVGAEDGVVYRYTIRALAGNNRTMLSGCRNTGRTMARLANRAIANVTAAGGGSVVCSWTTSTQASGYEVHLMSSEGKESIVKVNGAASGTKTLTGLKENESYSIQVRSYLTVTGVGIFYSGWSEAEVVSIGSEVVPEGLPAPEKPYKIANVVSGVHVYWKAIAGVEKFGLWRSETGKDGTYKWIANPTVPHFTDTTVVTGKTYYYKVTAMDVASNTHGAKSEAIGMTYVGTPDITGRSNVTSGIALGWNRIEGATGYAIYRKSYDGADAWARIATIEGNNTFTYTDTSVATANGTVYRYTIRALAGSDRKTLSGCRNTGRTMTRLTDRAISSVAAVSATSAKCTWTTTAQATGYEIRFVSEAGDVKTFTIGNYKTGAKIFKGLESGMCYTVQGRSYKTVIGVGTFYSGWSAGQIVTMP